MTTEYITSPMPGVFYRRSDPEEPPYVKEGDVVSEGDVVGLVGVMKNFHEIKAETNGTVSRIVADDEQEVEAGDDLIELEVD